MPDYEKLHQEILEAHPESILRHGSLNRMALKAHAANLRWWTRADGTKIERNKGEMIALMHSELSEMLEGVRKDSLDSHLPHRPSEEVELADLFIRALDYAGAFELDLDGAVAEKMAFNAQRTDHKHEHRDAPGGKKF